MNQQEERFDELTKALASTSISRGRMLRMLGGAALGGALGGWGLLLTSEDAEARKRKKRNPCKGKADGSKCGVCKTCEGGQCTPELPPTNFFCSGRCKEPVCKDDVWQCRNACDPAACCNIAGEGGLFFSCVNLKTSEFHCGSCGNECDAGETCCNGVCRNTRIDELNCGKCGKKCASGENCVDGACTPCRKVGSSCSFSFQCCSGRCSNGQCKSNKCDPPCPTGKTCCGNTCVDTKTSTNHCGACNVLCPSAGICNNGSCECPENRPKLCPSHSDSSNPNGYCCYDFNCCGKEGYDECQWHILPQDMCLNDPKCASC